MTAGLLSRFFPYNAAGAMMTSPSFSRESHVSIIAFLRASDSWSVRYILLGSAGRQSSAIRALRSDTRVRGLLRMIIFLDPQTYEFSNDKGSVKYGSKYFSFPSVTSLWYTMGTALEARRTSNMSNGDSVASMYSILPVRYDSTGMMQRTGDDLSAIGSSGKRRLKTVSIM